MLKDSKYQEESSTTKAKSSCRQNMMAAGAEGVLSGQMSRQDYSESDDDASDETDDEEDEDDIISTTRPGVTVRAYGLRAEYPLTSMPGRPDHKFGQAKYDRVLVLFKKIKTEPRTYWLESKTPCTLCFGRWPCIMKRTAPKCRSCNGASCSFYDPNAVETEPESPPKSNPTKPTTSSSARNPPVKRQFSELSYIDSSPVESLKKSTRGLAPARKEVVVNIEDEESDEEHTSRKINHHKARPTGSSSAKITSSRRHLDLSDSDSSPVEPQKKSTRGLVPARKETVVYVEDEESDEGATSGKTNHKKTKPTKPSMSRVTSAKRQVTELSEHSDVDSTPVNILKDTKKPRIALAPARKEEVDDVEGEESDDGKYWHNSKTTRRLIVRLEGQGWYRRLEGKGHCQEALIQMENLHWRSLNCQM